VPSDAAIALGHARTDPRFLAAWLRHLGPPAGVAGLLQGLDRHARPGRPRWTRSTRSFAWDAEDSGTTDWFPQGLSTSADADPSGTVHGREVVMVSWYRRTGQGRDQGARVSMLDITDARDARYGHVLLVEPRLEDGTVVSRPVAVHAGGIAWHGDLLYVAATYGGLRVFDLRDVVRVSPAAHDGASFALPERGRYVPAGDPRTRLRFSFVGLDRATGPPYLLAGEYRRGSARGRIARFALDEATGHLDTVGVRSASTSVCSLGIPAMQGVASLGPRFFVTASRGRYGRGDLWGAAADGVFRRRLGALPAGPEDLSTWPAREELWTLTEWPGRRHVIGLDARNRG
jgi:hypothetical protein